MDFLFENFCFMVVEEFLTLKSMPNTLQALRSEWNKPREEMNILSWYEVALKLHLPELIVQSNGNSSVLESLVQTLIKESSVKSRRSQETILTGLQILPKLATLPAIADTNNRLPSPPIVTKVSNAIGKPDNVETKVAKISKDHNNNNKSSYIKRQLDTNDKNGKQKQSNENWIPEKIRFRSLYREFGVAKETVGDMVKRDNGLAKELKRLMHTDLERAQVEERLGATKKIPCACCLIKFLHINLPLKVSRKAIMDIRIKWSGMLNSATVFSAAQAFDEMMDFTSQENNDEGSNKTTALAAHGKKGGPVPKYYDEVGVCMFCSQFFHDQEEYRPSFQTITYQERKAAYWDGKKKEQEYWDPLKMCEKDRELFESTKGLMMTSDEEDLE